MREKSLENEADPEPGNSVNGIGIHKEPKTIPNPRILEALGGGIEIPREFFWKRFLKEIPGTHSHKTPKTPGSFPTPGKAQIWGKWDRGGELAPKFRDPGVGIP